MRLQHQDVTGFRKKKRKRTDPISRKPRKPKRKFKYLPHLEAIVEKRRLEKRRVEFISTRRQEFQKKWISQEYKHRFPMIQDVGKDARTQDDNIEIKSHEELRTLADRPQMSRWCLGNKVSICTKDAEVESEKTWDEGLLIEYDIEKDLYQVEMDNEQKIWMNLSECQIYEFREIVWAKVKGWPWWPGQILLGMNKGVPVEKRAGYVTVAFFGTNDRSTVRDTQVCLYEDKMEEYANTKKKKLKQAMDEAKVYWELEQKSKEYYCSKMRKISSLQLRKSMKAVDWVGKDVSVFWPLDDEWYDGVVKRYNIATKKHFVVYDDSGVEWIDLMTQLVDLSDKNTSESNSKKKLPSKHKSRDEKKLECWKCDGRDNSWGHGSELLECVRCGRQCHSLCYNPLLVQKEEKEKFDPSTLRCPDCLTCAYCCRVTHAVDQLLQCEVCDQRFHAGCLEFPLKEDSLPKRWICNECVVCRSCGATKPSRVTEDAHWVLDYTMCSDCGGRYKGRKYCLLCDNVWQDNETNSMVCCDYCDRWLHMDCLELADHDIQKLERIDEQFQCPECVMRERSDRSSEILERLISEDKFTIFLKPVTDSVAPGYSDLIKVPMDFSTIRKKLEHLEYDSVDKFKADLDLIWRNAKEYNPPGSVVYAEAERIQKLSLTLFFSLHTQLKKEENGTDVRNGAPAETPAATQEQVFLEVQMQDVEDIKEDNTAPVIKPFLDFHTIICSDDFMDIIDICRMCGSFGDPEDFLFCGDCGEGYHLYCLESKLELNAQRRSGDWRCPECGVCEVCGKSNNDNELLVCDLCDQGTHLYCNDPPFEQVPSGGYRCAKCRRCRCCGVTAPLPNGTRWTHDYTLCGSCGLRYQRNEYCPVCDMVWGVTDEASMITCSSCRLHVHSHCAGIDVSVLRSKISPKIQQYLCPKCTNNLPPSRKPRIRYGPEKSLALAYSEQQRKRQKLDTHPSNGPRILRPVSAGSISSNPVSKPNKPVTSAPPPPPPPPGSPGKTSISQTYYNMFTLLDQIQCKRRRQRRRLLLDHTRVQTSSINTSRHENSESPPPSQHQNQQIIKHTSVQQKAKDEHKSKQRDSTPKPLNGAVPRKRTFWEFEKNGFVRPELDAQRRLQPKPIPPSPALQAFVRVTVDPRVCALCNKRGEKGDSEEGRLLYVDARRWVHVQCIRWSSNIEERTLGHLTNVPSEIDRARNVTCLSCQKGGASIRCCSRGCSANYHFLCALTSHCTFQSNGEVFCEKHRYQADPKHALPRIDSTEVRRRFVIINKTRSVTRIQEERLLLFAPIKSALYLRIGGLCVHRVGVIDPFRPLYHSSTHIFPIGFRSTRAYWSYTQPGKRCIYTCEILNGDSRPIFQVTVSDDEKSMFVGDTASAVWRELTSKRKDFMERNSRRDQTVHGDTYSFGLSGAHFFGFGHLVVMKMIERLPNSSLCQKYKFRHIKPRPLSEKKFRFKLVPRKEVPPNLDGSARCAGYSGKRNRNCWNTMVFMPHQAQIIREHLKIPSNPDRYAPTPTTTTGEQINNQDWMNAIQAQNHAPDFTAGYKKMKYIQKLPVIGRSSIHECGLFATERAEPGDVLIEYVGEIVRQKVADQREKKYSRNGEGVCYMFRINDDSIVDATTQGNAARFINHSCDPNSYPVVFEIKGQPKIIIIAKRTIEMGEEITYDYKFPFEEEKLVCNCGASGCYGRMN